jgi:hypothetical protein
MPKPKPLDIYVDAATSTLSKQNPGFDNIVTSSTDDISFHMISFTIHGEAPVQHRPKISRRKHIKVNKAKPVNVYDPSANTKRIWHKELKKEMVSFGINQFPFFGDTSVARCKGLHLSICIYC